MIKTYLLTLTTLAPLHIGSGIKYSSKEYIYENQQFYFPEMGRLFQYIQSLNEEASFSSFLLQSGNWNNTRNPRLIDYLIQNNIRERDFGGYLIDSHGFEGNENPNSVNEILGFIQDPFGDPYIPGSSLKGALRTILVNSVFQTDKLPFGPTATYEESIFYNIRVSDSQPISKERLTLAQKWDYSDRKSEAKFLPIHRQAIKPLTKVSFVITCEGVKAIELVEDLPKHAKTFANKYDKFFLNDQNIEIVHDCIQSPIYIGGGSGCWTKTIMDQAEKHVKERHSRGKTRMVGRGVLKLTKYPIVTMKTNIRTIPLAYRNNFYLMGKSMFQIKER